MCILLLVLIRADCSLPGAYEFSASLQHGQVKGAVFIICLS